MELVACVLCGRLFETYDKKICPMCAKKEDEYYQQVKTLIRENPGMTFKRIIEEVGVPERLMRRWLRDGRLEVNNKETYGLKCERCNKEILQGKYCVACREYIQKGLNELMKDEKKNMLEKRAKDAKGKGMRFI